MIPILGFPTWAVATSAQLPRPGGGDALVDARVFGSEAPTDATALSAAVKAELDTHHRRFIAHASRRTRPRNSPELEMVYEAQVRYERRLVAVTDNPLAADLAMGYVDELRPCYEWEGFHDARNAKPSSRLNTGRLMPADRSTSTFRFSPRTDGYVRRKDTTMRNGRRAPPAAVRSTRTRLPRRGSPRIF